MIVLKNICKTFEDKKVLEDISFHIAEGESVGIIGLNGAGKTTLLNIIAGLLKPDSGFIRINGAKQLIAKRPALKEVAYISGTKSQLWEDMVIKSSFENAAIMYGIDSDSYNHTLDEMDEVLRVKELLDTNPQNLSLGERMRCELMYALLTNPKILMLDEAMIGLDVTIKHQIVEYFANNRSKYTLLYTSHNLLEVERICDRIILIDKGKIIYDGKTKNIIKEFSPMHRLELNIQGMFPDFLDIPVRKYKVNNNQLTIEYDKEIIDTAQIIKYVMSTNKINDVRLFEPDLEDTIKKIYERKF